MWLLPQNESVMSKEPDVRILLFDRRRPLQPASVALVFTHPLPELHQTDLEAARSPHFVRALRQGKVLLPRGAEQRLGQPKFAVQHGRKDTGLSAVGDQVSLLVWATVSL